MKLIFYIYFNYLNILIMLSISFKNKINDFIKFINNLDYRIYRLIYNIRIL